MDNLISERAFARRPCSLGLTDPEEFSADEIAIVCHERWELELGTTRSEMKLLDREEAIRSRIPAEVHRNCGDLPCV